MIQRIRIFLNFISFEIQSEVKYGKNSPMGVLAAETMAMSLDMAKVRWMSRADRKSQVRQCLVNCTADFWSSMASESAEQKL